MAVCIRCRTVLEPGGRFCPQCGATLELASLKSRVDAGTELDLGWAKVLVGDVVGEGGMGVVRRGWLYYNPNGPQANTPPHPVAVKVLHPLLRGRPRARQLFLGEAEALRRLSHPNIVHFFGLLQDPGQLAIVIELVDGQPLSQIIAWHAANARATSIPCLPFMRAWNVLSQLLGALAAIHALGIIHRDVKPSNILIRRDEMLKLTDFGIARVPLDEVRNTGGMAPGTGAYMAPEQVLGRDIDARADLYSAAIVLYEMLTGVTPFDAPDRNEITIRTAQVEESPRAPTGLIAQAPPVLDVLMARALAKDPMHRFSSAVEMGEAFRTALGLPKSRGWTAQQRLAEHAQAISAMGLQATGAPAVAPTQAEKLRTAIMVAYKS